MTSNKQEVKMYDRQGEDENFGTINDIMEWMKENGVPFDAEIHYAGCGSHNITFVWTREATAAELLEMRDKQNEEERIASEQRARGLIA